jgi:ATP-dependent RNA helicase DHX8/PRP22
MDAMKKFKELCLINKVKKELEINIGLKPEDEGSKETLKIITDYIMDMCSKSKSLDDFINKLEGGADLPLSVIKNLYNIIKEGRGGETNNFHNQNLDKNSGTVFGRDGHVYDFEHDPTRQDEAKHASLLPVNENPNTKEEFMKEFSSLAIPNKNKEELDIEFGVIFDEEAEEKNKITKNRSKSISPIKLKKDKTERDRKRRSKSRSKSRSRSHKRKSSKYEKDRDTDRDRSDTKHRREKKYDKSDKYDKYTSEKNYKDDKDNVNSKSRKNKSRRRSRSRSRSSSSSSSIYKPINMNKLKYSNSDNANTNDNWGISENYEKTQFEDKIEVGRIYNGIVTNVLDYGCFVLLDIAQNKWHIFSKNTSHRPLMSSSSGNNKRIEGLVHVSEIRQGPRIASAKDVVRSNQNVKVKIVSIDSSGTGKISLSMKQVDQTTGRDLGNINREKEIMKSKKISANEFDFDADFGGINDLYSTRGKLPEEKFNPAKENTSQQQYGEITGISLDTIVDKKAIKRLSSPELWELNQLKHANALEYVDDPLMIYNEDDDGEVEENAEIELKEEEPPFLKGQTAKAGVRFSPIRIVLNPDGGLHRAAIQQGELAKDRRELREQQQRSILDSIPKEILNQYDDPNMDIKNRIKNIKELTSNSRLDKDDWKKETMIKKFHASSRSLMSIKEQRESLPIYRLRNELLDAIDKNRILVVIGETGSGKTTQITQYLVETGYAKYGKIGCTQPRRVAAMSVAKRVSEEFGCKLGEYVGYSIRFEDCCSQDTIIKYMTDGMLLREALIDKNLTQYSVIMLDEAHERTIHTDILFGLLKQALKVRNDLRLIVTSATLDAEKFSAFFNNCPIFRIPGRTFPVEIFYAKELESDYLDAALITVMQIHLTEPRGDILVFLTGQEEIDTACQILQDRMSALGKDVPPMIILPVYSALPSDMQTKIFEPAPEGTRKCVIATNIAEASLTIDGIYYVVDPGFAKIKAYNPKIGMDSLVVAPISQSSAHQRAGRAGRTGPGKCYRLYTLESFQNDMLNTAIPEIQRTNLSNTVLLLKAMGINDLINFDFMDPPPVQTLISAMEMLYNLGALDDEGLLTKLGRRMAEFPLEPQLSKMLLTSVDLSCSEEIITIVSMLSVQNIFYRPRDRQALADQKRAKFYHPDGDHLTLLNVYEMWKANKMSYPWCHDNFIQARALKKAEDIKKQLVAIMERYKLPVKNCNKDYDKVRKSITAGFFAHVARKDPKEGYKTLVDNQTIYIHPSSALFNKAPEWVVYHELVLTSKEYMREVTAIEPKWLVEVAGRFFKNVNPNVMSKRKRNEKLEPLHNKYEDPNAWRLSKRRGLIY